MDGPQSPLLHEVRETVDPKTKQRVFKFVDVRPSDKLLGAQFNGRGLYATATLEAGWFSAIKSISTPAVIAFATISIKASPRSRPRSDRGRRSAGDRRPGGSASRLGTGFRSSLSRGKHCSRIGVRD
jgi:hypothetical protein